MKLKIDDIEKKNPFQVPDGYFDRLTLDIQQRIAEPKKAFGFGFYLKWSLAPAFILIAGFFFYLNSFKAKPDNLLAEIDNASILAYLEQTELQEIELASMLEEGNLLYDLDQLDDLNLEDGDLEGLLNEFELNDEYL